MDKVKSTPSYLDPRTLADLEGLSLRTRYIIEGLLTGTHRSAHLGYSTEFSQHRPYVPGDELRRVDWKALGRTDRLYVKQFHDETNLTCTFLLDASASMTYRGADSPLSKFDYASCLVMSLVWLLRQQGDAISLATFSDRPLQILPPAANDARIAEMIDLIEATSPGGPSAIDGAIRTWAAEVGRRQLVIVVSDLFGEAEAVADALGDLDRFGHEVIVFQILDRDELEFPFDQYTRFADLETNDDVTLDAETWRAAYLHAMQEFNQLIQLRCHQCSIDFCQLISDESLASALGNFLTSRNRKTTVT